MERKKTMNEQDHTDELAMRISRDLARLVDTGICKLTAGEQSLIDAALRDGAFLMVICVLTPHPTYVCSLSTGPDSDPIEIFRVTLSAQAMTLLTSGGQTAGH
jgi:hypothetical protein